MIYRLSEDRNTEVRRSLADQLVIFDCEGIEKILYHMLFDQNRTVRLEALDALVIGRNESTIKKAQAMLEGEGQLIRAYAVAVLFNIIVNRYGVNDRAFQMYKELSSDSFRKEKDLRVLIEYYQNEYFIDHKKGMELLKASYLKAIEEEKYDIIWVLVHIFQDIQNRRNSAEINQILNNDIEKLLDEQKKFVKEMEKRKIPYRLLIIDQEDVYLSHIVSSILESKCISGVEINTAGLNIGIVEKEKIEAFLKRYNLDNNKEYDSKKVIESYLYDYVICLNISADEYNVDFCQNTYFEHVNVDNEQQIFEVCEQIKQIVSRNMYMS